MHFLVPKKCIASTVFSPQNAFFEFRAPCYIFRLTEKCILWWQKMHCVVSPKCIVPSAKNALFGPFSKMGGIPDELLERDGLRVATALPSALRRLSPFSLAFRRHHPTKQTSEEEGVQGGFHQRLRLEGPRAQEYKKKS